jgi:putative transposase
MEQMARNAIDPECGYLRDQRCVLHDRDTKFCATFRSIPRVGGREVPHAAGAQPNLNAFAERWVRSVKQKCLRKLVLFGEGSLRRALSEYMTHYHSERNHQGKQNLLLFPEHKSDQNPLHRVRRVPRLGGLLSYYTRAA